MIVSGCSESVSTRESPAPSTTGDTVTHVSLQRPVILFESHDQNPLGKRQPARLYRTSTVAGCFGTSAFSRIARARSKRGRAPDRRGPWRVRTTKSGTLDEARVVSKARADIREGESRGPSPVR